MFAAQDGFSVPIVHRKTLFLPFNPSTIYPSQLLSKSRLRKSNHNKVIMTIIRCYYY